MKNSIILILFLSISFSSIAQTVGVLQTTDESLEGYTFFSPFSSTKAFLIDNCGRLINEWDRGARPGLAAYFLENGLMLRTYKVSPQGPFNSASNAGGLELVDWDNNRVWGYEFNTATWLSHHDAVMMPNGNILVLTWEIVEAATLIELGRNPNEIAPEGIAWNERIIEIKPIGSDDIEIIWEWRIRDHYIQDFDSEKSNFGVVSEHPELFNINLPDINSSNSHADFDYNHFNAIDYNEDLDQILISVRNSDEIWIIDHSTTTAEAATHAGGTYGKGGDILYRWGNPSAYERGPIADQQFFGQHGVHWIRSGLADEGKILVYNNGNERPGPDFSEVQILVPEQFADGSYPVPLEDPFGPAAPEWSYGNLGNENFSSPFLSNAQRLTNGNTLVNAGSPGNIFELNANREIVWEYEIPLNGNSPVVQGSNPFNNGNFRAYKYDKNFAGFEGLDLTPGEIIEIDNNPPICNIVSAIDHIEIDHLKCFYQMESQRIIVEQSKPKAFTLSVFNLQGQPLFFSNGNQEISSFIYSPKTNGIYIIQIVDHEGNLWTNKIWIGKN